MNIKVFFRPSLFNNHPKIIVLANPPNPAAAAVQEASSSVKGFGNGVLFDISNGI